ncbi:MAG: hypothetical protein HFJ94_03180 [Muribaculaceae bacterium]|nr:hypothetical protein [Muribaculaceae bacterium]
MKYIIFSLIMACAPLCNAMTPDEARSAYAAGDYAGAVATLRAIADKEPRNASANTMAGIALLRTGNPLAARKYLSKGSNDAKIALAEICYDEYDFDGAEEWLEKYSTAQKRARKPESAEVETLTGRIEAARAMMDRVERIVIIDSISVPADDFFRAYRLASSAGSVTDTSVLPPDTEAASPTSVFVTEDGGTMIWSAPDENENYVLMQASRLADGSWEAPSGLGDILNEGGDANFPFLMSDGVTLYFANDGENSIGGYDIFISRNNGEKFLQPQNVGMPYNSPFNDYLLAIDEETGIGWWATDRNRIEDSITIYRFIPQELRINYPVDTENLAALAQVKDYRSTWPEGEDYAELNRKVDNLRPTRRSRTAEMHFALPDGSVRTSVDSFHSAQARSLARDYINELNRLREAESALANLRESYAAGNSGAAADINAAEKDIELKRARIKELTNLIVNAEM